MRLTYFPVLREIRDEYIKLRQEGNSRDQATTMLLHSYAREIALGTADDGLLFWIGLADAQYYRKELSSAVAQKAINALDQITAVGWDITPGDIARRREHYAQAPMPERSVGKPRAKFRTRWRKGDVFAYPLSGSNAEKLGIAGQYALLRKVDDVEFGDGRLLPVVTISVCKKDEFPATSSDLQKIPMLKITSGRFGKPESKYEYRAEILFKSERQLNASALQYVGYFPDVSQPADEVILTHPGDIMMLLPENINDTLCIFWKLNFYYTFGHMPV